MGIRYSGYDLRTYFFQLCQHPRAVPRQCFGRRLSYGEKVKYNLNPDLEYRAALRAVVMGDTNAVDTAKETHREILAQGSCMRPSETMIYGEPLPRGAVMEGLYIDDRLVFGLRPRHCLKDDFGEDKVRALQGLAACKAAKVVLPEEKSFGFCAG